MYTASDRVSITGGGGMLGASVYAACKLRFEHVLATDIDLNEPWLEPLDVRDIAQFEIQNLLCATPLAQSVMSGP